MFNFFKKNYKLTQLNYCTICNSTSKKKSKKCIECHQPIICKHCYKTSKYCGDRCSIRYMKKQALIAILKI